MVLLEQKSIHKVNENISKKDANAGKCVLMAVANETENANVHADAINKP